MAKATVPLALLMQLAHPFGQRLSKRVEFKKPVAPPYCPAYTPGRYRAGPTQRNLLQSDVAITVISGNLLNTDYRYWVGSVNKESTYSCCRCCHQAYHSAETRTAHHNAGDCKTIIASTQRALRLVNLCGVCGNYAQRRIWGMPLCFRCEPGWKFTPGGHFETRMNILKRTFEEDSEESKQTLLELELGDAGLE